MLMYGTLSWWKELHLIIYLSACRFGKASFYKQVKKHLPFIVCYGGVNFIHRKSLRTDTVPIVLIVSLWQVKQKLFSSSVKEKRRIALACIHVFLVHDLILILQKNLNLRAERII